MAKRREDFSFIPYGYGINCQSNATGANAEEDWETDPDMVNYGSDRDLRWGRFSQSCSVESISSITTELSKSIRNCEGFNKLHSKTSSVSDIQQLKSLEFPEYNKTCASIGVKECALPHSQAPYQNVMYHKYHNRENDFKGKKGKIFHRADMNTETQRSIPFIKAQSYYQESRSNSTSESSGHIGSESLNKSRHDHFQPYGRDYHGIPTQNNTYHLQPDAIKRDPFILDNYQLDYNETESVISGIDRTSTFSTNAAQKLDRFLRKKLDAQNNSPYPIDSYPDASNICENTDDLPEGINSRCLQAKRPYLCQLKQLGSKHDPHHLVASRSLENIRQVMDKTKHIQNLQVHFEKEIQKSNKYKEKEQQISRRKTTESVKRQYNTKGQTERCRGGAKHDKTPQEDICKCIKCKRIFKNEIVCDSECKNQNFPQSKIYSQQKDFIPSDKIKKHSFKYNATDRTFDNYMCQHIRQCETCQNINKCSEDSSTEPSFCEDDRNYKTTLKQHSSPRIKRPSNLLKECQVERKNMSESSDEYIDIGTRKFSETVVKNYNSGKMMMVHPSGDYSQSCACNTCRLLTKKSERIQNLPRKGIHKCKDSLESVDSNVYCKPSKSWHGSAKDSVNQYPYRFCEKCQSHRTPKHVGQEMKHKQSRNNSKQRQSRLEATSSLEKLAPRMRRRDRVRLIAEAFDRRDRKDIERVEKEKVQRQLQEEEWEKKKLAFKQSQNKHRKKGRESPPNGASEHRRTIKRNPRQYCQDNWQHNKRTEKAKSECHRASKEYADESATQHRHRHHRRS